MSSYRFSLIFVISNILSIDILYCGCCNSCRKQPNTMSENSGGGFRLANTRLQNCIDNVVTVCQRRIQNISLCGMTIFDECDKNMSATHDEGKKIISALIGGDKNVLNHLSDLEKRAIACMLGMAIGDAVGAPFEFVEVQRDLYDAGKYGSIRTKIVVPYDASFGDGRWTDDCSMGLCLADSLIVNNGVLKPIDLMKRFLAWWYCGYNNAMMHANKKSISWGLGGQIRGALDNFINDPTLEKAKGDPDGPTNGNGSIMRNAAIPICYHNDIDRALHESENQSYTTHAGVQAAECCRLLTYIVCKIFNEGGSKTLREILDEISSFQTKIESIKGLVESRNKVESHESKGKVENWNWKAKKFAYNKERAKKDPRYIGGFSVDCMAMAFHILYYTDSFEQAIDVTSKLGGDADTVAAVVGQIAGAYYSLEKIPVDWIKLVSKWDNGDIIAKALLLVRINK